MGYGVGLLNGNRFGNVGKAATGTYWDLSVGDLVGIFVGKGVGDGVGDLVGKRVGARVG